MAEASDLALLDPDELEHRLAETRRELFNLRFQLATGQLDNTSRMGRVRRDVARILTVLRERQIAESAGTFVTPTAAQQESARAHLAAEDEAAEAAAAAARHDHDHGDHDGHDHGEEAADADELDAEALVADELDADVEDPALHAEALVADELDADVEDPALADGSGDAEGQEEDS
jgi:large subunit ribosomal protein L29